MNIGERIRIKHSIAGKYYSFSEDDIVTITKDLTDGEHIAIVHVDSLLRGGMAEAESFPAEIKTSGTENENINLLPDNTKTRRVYRKRNTESKESGVQRSDDDQGQSISVPSGTSDEQHSTELREDAPSSSNPGIQ